MSKLFFILLVLGIQLNSCENQIGTGKKSSSEDMQVLNGTIGNLDCILRLKSVDGMYTGVLDYVESEYDDVDVEGYLKNSRLILNEFDLESDISGSFTGKYDKLTYVGKWKSPANSKSVNFAFSIENTNLRSNKEVRDDFYSLRLGPKQLITEHFSPFKFKNDSVGYFKDDTQINEVEFRKIIEYTDNAQDLILVLFAIYKVNDEFEREAHHAASGSIAVAKYVQINNNIKLLQFSDDCECGYGDWGEINLPELEKYGSHYFLVNESISVHQGIVESFFFMCNTINFRSAIHFSAGVDGTAGSEDGSDPYGYDTSHKFIEKNGKLLLILDTTVFSNDFESRTDTTFIYTYDEDIHEFKE